MDLLIPQAGDAVSEVQLVEWFVADGQEIGQDQPVYSIESEKSVLEVTAPVAGRVEIVAQRGEFLSVGQLVGRIV